MSCEAQALRALNNPIAETLHESGDRRDAGRRGGADAPRRRTGARLVYLDLLRAAAIFLVLGAHTPFRIPDQTVVHGFFRAWHRMGWVGVDLFFVLSGFLVGGLLFQEHCRHGHVRYGRFLTRRAFKIWPAYLSFLFVIFIWDIVGGHGSLSARLSDTASRGWPYLIHIQNYYGPLVERIGHTWSLAVEEHFYLLLPLVLIGLTWLSAARGDGVGRPSDEVGSARDHHPFRGVPWVFAGLAVVCLGLRLYSWHRDAEFDEFVHHWPTHIRIDSLMAGVALAYAVYFARDRVERLRPWRYLIGLAGVACFVPFAVDPIDYASGFSCTFGYTLLAAGAAALVLLAWFEGTPAPGEGGGVKDRNASAPVRGLARVGAYSYSIYLWHMPLMIPVMRVASRTIGNRLHLWESPWFFLVEMAAYVGGALAVGVVMFYAIEKPALALRERWFPSRTATVPPVAPVVDSAARGEDAGGHAEEAIGLPQTVAA